MSRPIIIITPMPALEGDGWKNEQPDEDKIRRECAVAFGVDVPVVFMPPGAEWELYWFDEEGGPDDLRKLPIDDDDDDGGTTVLANTKPPRSPVPERK